ncbi:golgin subfamily A member 6-like protein 1 [Drosophila elegans]|uniref:golgin subfamily A member 6-like protein 1 n=1 Tax=Drosophila elegans TaxID=30023 RepID=UPI0007E60D09|nr:golgin subfamily A member 6-like protein 1 [Drosophila elegans]
MEETKILENEMTSPADKMNPASAQKEQDGLYLMRLSDSKDSLDPMNNDIEKDQSKVDVAENQGQQEGQTKEYNTISEAKQENGDINEDSDKHTLHKSKEKSQEKLIDTDSNKTLAVEENQENIKDNEQGEENLESLSGKKENEELIEVKDLVIPKDTQDTTAESEPDLENTLPPTQEKLESPEKTMETIAAEESTKKEEQNDPLQKIRQDMEQYFNGIVALEEKKRLQDEMNAKEAEDIIKEEQKRKNWMEMLMEFSQATTLSSSSTSSGKTPRSVVAAILQRSAKAEYKRKMSILTENLSFRLGLIKQLKHDMKNNFKNKAQQLYSEYHSVKNQTQYRPT